MLFMLFNRKSGDVMNLTFIHILSLFITLFIVLGSGIYSSRKVKSADDFDVGGRSAGVIMVAGSIAATIIGGAATIGTAQGGFTFGFAAWWFTLGSGIGFLIMAAFYAKPLRKSGLTTISEYLVINFGSQAGPLASIAASLGIFFSVVSSSLSSVHLIGGILNLDFFASAVVVVMLVTGFVFFGGITSSGMAGLFKVGLIFATIFLGGFLAFNDMGGLSGMHEAFPELPWFSMFGIGADHALFNLFSMIVGVISTQSYVQSLFSAKNSRTAMLGCLLAACIAIPIGLPSVIIGMFIKLHHPELNSIDTLPYYLCNYLPDWLGGAGLAALVLSCVGSIAGLSLGVGTLFSRDIFGAVFKVHDSRKLMWINKLTVLAVTFAALIFVHSHLDSSVLQWNYLSMALRGAGIFLPVTAVIFFKGIVGKTAGLLSMFGGIASGCIWHFAFPQSPYTLFVSLFFNLLFLVPSIAYHLLKRS